MSEESPPPLRIIIHALGSAGDVHPFVGVGRALVERGHEVFVATNPVFRDTVIDGGLGFRALGTEEQFRQTRDDPDLWHPLRAMRAVARHAIDPCHAPILAVSRELHLPGRTVLVASSLALAARTARDLLGAPLASVHLAPAVFRTEFRQPDIHGMPFGTRAPRFLKRLQWLVAGNEVDRLVLPALNRFRRDHGLAPAKNVLADWWHSPDRVIALFPDWFAPAQPDWPGQTRQTGFPLFDEKGVRASPPGLAEFLDAGAPPVVFTPGSAMSRGDAFFREAAEALRLSGRRGVFLTRFPECIPRDLPAGVRHFSYAPFSEVLPRAAALVHHGGVGTCAQALQAGVPQLIQPMAHDQLDTLSRVRDLGVGAGLRPEKFLRHNIAEALDRLLDDPEVRRRGTAVASRFQPKVWMTHTCRLVEALAPASHPRPAAPPPPRAVS